MNPAFPNATADKAEWAAQRIRGLSFPALVRSVLGLDRNRSKGETIKTLINEFHYPKRGPGMMWTKMAEQIERIIRGGID